MERKLKIEELYRQDTRGYRTAYTRVPQIRLKGRWLKQAGFEAGGQVNVVVEDGRLVIEKGE